MAGPVVGAVLAGGRSSRFGSDKALADAAGAPLGRRVVDALRAGGADPVVVIGGSAGAALGVPTIPDRYPGAGPLAGLATALRWARNGLVVVAPCDLPLLTGDQVAELVAAADETTAAVAAVGGAVQPSLGCWPARCSESLHRAVRVGDRAWRRALDLVPHLAVELPATALADADSPDRLAELLGLETDTSGDYPPR
jgi:molybdopterin-guanine dinucleotide biosynthesis protein A